MQWSIIKLIKWKFIKHLLSGAKVLWNKGPRLCLGLTGVCLTSSNINTSRKLKHEPYTCVSSAYRWADKPWLLIKTNSIRPSTEPRGTYQLSSGWLVRSIVYIVQPGEIWLNQRWSPVCGNGGTVGTYCWGRFVHDNWWLRVGWQLLLWEATCFLCCNTTCRQNHLVNLLSCPEWFLLDNLYWVVCALSSIQSMMVLMDIL